MELLCTVLLGYSCFFIAKIVAITTATTTTITKMGHCRLDGRDSDMGVTDLTGVGVCGRLACGVELGAAVMAVGVREIVGVGVVGAVLLSVIWNCVVSDPQSPPSIPA